MSFGARGVKSTPASCKASNCHHRCYYCLPTTLTSASGEVESNLPTCGPPAIFPVHLASSAVTPAETVHKSRGAYVGAVEEMMCVMYVSVTKGA